MLLLTKARLRPFAAAIAALVAFSTPAHAQREFAAYEGPDAIRTGVGGSRITRHGIDYWTTGTPPRRYQVLGVMTDRRDEDWGVRAAGSPSIARMTLRLGGNAVIIMNQRDRTQGYIVPVGTSVIGGDSTITTTELLVIRYLDEPSTPPQE